ncbi:MAG: hypothetical protein K0R29_517 [Pseudobdellovibrio sp.]|jgi:signal transduction histidine kinase|nr:hypothetical protein [Pseudobdellovibrio sp.]
MINKATSDAVIVLSPTANDGRLACDVLTSENIEAFPAKDIDQLCEKIKEGCAALIIAEEALSIGNIEKLQATLALQDAWSDLPIIVFTGDRLSYATEIFSQTGNIYLLERPFSRFTLVRSVQVALRARKKQYQVRDLLGELQTSRDDADKANAAKSQFLANMSHEIRTPIGAIIGFVDLMRTEPSAKAKEEFMSVIERNSQQLLRLIDDILDLSKIEAGKLIIENINFKLTDLLADFNSVMGLKAVEKGIHFRLVIDSLIPQTISSDPVRLKQILINVVGNAIKFTSRGSVELRVSFQNGYLKFCVTDTGVGLSANQSSKLFQPFVQADSSTTRKFGGTGLGLALSRSLSESLGGRFELLSSQEGVGSTFFFEIKPGLYPESEMVGQSAIVLESGQQRKESRDKILEGLNVLLVEDSPDNQVLISMYLNKAGARVSLADDGTKGVEMALKNPYDVVVMDVQMPKMDGHTATRALRSHKYDRPIIALTAHAMKEERLRCFESGFTDFLTKPIEHDRLLNVLFRYRPSY